MLLLYLKYVPINVSYLIEFNMFGNFLAYSPRKRRIAILGDSYFTNTGVHHHHIFTL